MIFIYHSAPRALYRRSKPKDTTMLRLIIPAAVLSISLLPSAPVLAQDGGEKVNQLIIYGDDQCPQSSETEITVCARKEEAERYRIPEPLRESQSPENQAWNSRVLAYETVGKTGTLSCSPVGAGGSLGCTNKLINNAFAEKRGASDVRFAQLIAEERARRLSTIDSDAAETQARVESLERQYEERRKREEDGVAQPLPIPPAPAAKP